jgi:hypothetical protein
MNGALAIGLETRDGAKVGVGPEVKVGVSIRVFSHSIPLKHWFPGHSQIVVILLFSGEQPQAPIKQRFGNSGVSAQHRVIFTEPPDPMQVCERSFGGSGGGVVIVSSALQSIGSHLPSRVQSMYENRGSKQAEQSHDASLTIPQTSSSIALQPNETSKIESKQKRQASFDTRQLEKSICFCSQDSSTGGEVATGKAV